VQSRVYSVSILHYVNKGHIAFYRTDGTRTGGGLHIYDLTVPRLCRLMRGMVNTACEKRVGMSTVGNWSSWWIVGLVEKVRKQLDGSLEAATLG
jgi:hypothetical protein